MIAAGGLHNGAFVALALLFLAGDVLAVSCAVVVAARRLGEGAAWARLLLDVVEGVTIAVGLVAILLGTGILGLLGVVIGVSVIVCLHMPSANAMFEGKPIVPWEVYARTPRESSLPVPTLPRMPRSGMARPLSSDPRTGAGRPAGLADAGEDLAVLVGDGGQPAGDPQPRGDPDPARDPRARGRGGRCSRRAAAAAHPAGGRAPGGAARPAVRRAAARADHRRAAVCDPARARCDPGAGGAAVRGPRSG